MRNRRNTRKRNVVLDTITNKNFIIIVSILLIIMVVAEGIIQIRKTIDKKQLAKQAEELQRQTGEIFTAIENDLTNPQTNGETARTRTAKISAVGDILCQMDMINDAKTDDGYDFSHMFTEVSKFVKDSDLAIGTLETNFVNEKYSGAGKYNSPAEFLTAVKNSGIGLVSLAHNHVLDYGTQGMTTTLNKIKEQGIETTGISEIAKETSGENVERNLTNDETATALNEANNEQSKDEIKANETEKNEQPSTELNEQLDNAEFTGNIKEINGIKIAFLGYTYGLSNENEVDEETKKSANIYSNELALKDIEYAEKKSNYIIVIMHWGDVNSSEISEYQRNITSFLVENGVDMILGSHPSVVEPMEMIQTEEGKNVLVAYSLGNYISTLKYANADVELILNIQISKSSDSNKAVLQKVDYTPIYVLDNGTKSENRFELTDMKKLAQDYANGDTSRITRKTYESILTKLEKLQNKVNSK